MNSDGSEQKRLTYSYFGSEYPIFSSDGKKIYFASKRDNSIDVNGIRNNKLYVMNEDGTNVRAIKYSDYNDYQPALLN
jgi:Tol biopolymer transport system component